MTKITNAPIIQCDLTLFIILFVGISLTLSQLPTVNAFLTNSHSTSVNASVPFSMNTMISVLPSGAALIGLKTSCADKALVAHNFSTMSDHCVIWYTDTFFMDNAAITFPVTPLMDWAHRNSTNKNTHADLPPSQTTVFVPVFGLSSMALCNSSSGALPLGLFPCAIFVMETESALQSPWLIDVATNEKVLLPENVIIPFRCSQVLPCTVRAPSSQGGQAGGCSSPTKSDTLVVVTWNMTRYLFRPVRLFAGTDGIFSVESLEIGWATAQTGLDGVSSSNHLLYDVSLQFHTIVNSPPQPSKGISTASNNTSRCTLHLLAVDGTDEIFDVDSDDSTSTTGLTRLAFAATMRRDTPAPVLCYPYLQHVPVTTSTPQLGGSSTALLPSTGTLLSLTCSNGYGLLWMYNLMAASPPHIGASLVGEFRLPQPAASNASNKPHIVDLSVVAVSSSCDTTSTVDGVPTTMFVTKVAMLDVGLYETLFAAHSPDGVGEFSNVNAIFATYLSGTWTEKESLNLTQTLMSTAVSSAEYVLNVSPIVHNATAVVHLRHGMGWVVSEEQPVVVTLPYSATISINPNGSAPTPTCDGNTLQTALWYCDFGALYGGLTEDYAMLINGSTGTVATWDEAQPYIVQHFDRNGNEQFRVLGGSSSVPVLIDKGPNSSYTRLPSSPLFILSSVNPGGTSNAVVVESAESQTLLFSSQRAMLVQANVNAAAASKNDTSSWYLEADPPAIFQPTAFAASADLPQRSIGNVSTFPISDQLTSYSWTSSGSIAVVNQLLSMANMSSNDTAIRSAMYWQFTGVSSFTGRRQASFGADRNTTEIVNELPLLPPVYSAQHSLYLVCKGSTLYAFKYTIGTVVEWEVTNLCSADPKTCYCRPENPLFITKNFATNADQTNYIIVTVFYPFSNATQVIVVSFDGVIMGRSSTTSRFFDAECNINNFGNNNADETTGMLDTTPMVFGQFLEVSEGIGTVGIVTPFVGTRCMLLAAWYAPANTFLFVTFAHTGARPSYVAAVKGDGVSVILSTEPIFDLGINEESFGGNVYVFEAEILWSVVTFNIPFYGTLLPSQVFGVLPSVSLSGAARFAYAQGMFLIVMFQNFTQLVPNCSNASNVFLCENFYVYFEIYDVVTRNQSWYTNPAAVPRASISNTTLSTITAFTSAQLDLSFSYIANVWACVAIGILLCVNNMQSSSPLLEFAGDYWGEPVESGVDLLVWTTMGHIPCAFSKTLVAQQWAGFSWGTGSRGGLSSAQPMDSGYQSSCANLIVSNQGIIVQCYLDGPKMPPRIVLVQTISGVILMGYGPTTSSIEKSVLLVSNGATLIYLDNGDRNTIVSLSLETFQNVTAPPKTVLISACASTSDSTYVLTVLGDYVMSAYRTPFDPSVPYTLTSSSNEIAYGTYSFPTYLVFSIAAFSLAPVLRGPSDQLSLLNGALPPSLFAFDTLYLSQGTSPPSVVNPDGTQILMSYLYCDICGADCPRFCVLDLASGDQIQYTASAQFLTGKIKTYGQATFDPYNTTTEVLQYSGNFSLTLLRYGYFIQNGLNTQVVITCQENTPTTQAAPGRYCYRETATTVAGSWSIIEITQNSAAIATTITQSQFGSSLAPMYSAYTATTPLSSSVISVGGELSLPIFLLNHSYARPTVVPASNEGITNILSVVQINRSITLATDAGNITYTEATCDATEELLRLCPAEMVPFAPAIASIASQFKTILWTSVGGSNWGDGFLAAGFSAVPAQMLRSFRSGSATTCSTHENKDPACVCSCQPISTVSSQFHFLVSSYMLLLSWLPIESQLQYDPTTVTNEVSQQSNSFDQEKFELVLKLYPVENGDEVVMTGIWKGTEWVLMTVSAGTMISDYGVQFSCSQCEFYLLPNVVAQPFDWLAFGAVKTLVVTIVFYLLEHRVRAVERRKSELRDQILFVKDRQEVKQRELRESSLASLHQIIPHERESTLQAKGANQQHGTAEESSYINTDEDEGSAIAFELQKLQEKERALKIGWCLPNIIDAVLSLLATMGAFTQRKERYQFLQEVRNNIFYVELDDLANYLLILLAPSAEGDLSAELTESDLRDSVKTFAELYQQLMCRNMCWILDQRHSISKEYAVLKAKLKAAYTLFSEPQLQSMSVSQIVKLLGEEENASENRKPAAVADGDMMGSSRTASAVSLNIDEQTKLMAECSPNPPQDQPNNIDSVIRELRTTVNEFNSGHFEHPQCFRFAMLPLRKVTALLQPSSPLLVLSLLQAAITIVVYTIDVYSRSRNTQLTKTQIYQCVYFMVFNSSLPSTILVNSFLHADLHWSASTTPSYRERLLSCLRSPFVVVSVLLIAPALLTHVLPGLLLYAWVTAPAFALALGIEVFLRRLGHKPHPSRLLIAARMASRVFILFVTSIALSVSFNSVDAFLWQRAGDGHFTTGTYAKQPYFNSLAQDYNSRSLACVWEHLFHTVSNFLQMGFLLL